MEEYKSESDHGRCRVRRAVSWLVRIRGFSCQRFKKPKQGGNTFLPFYSLFSFHASLIDIKIPAVPRSRELI